MTAPERPFLRQLIEYIEASGEPGFGQRIRPADPRLLAELEELVRDPIPQEFLAYLLAMGGDTGGFRWFSQDEGGLGAVVDYYRWERNDPKRGEAPRGGSVLIAEGEHVSLAIDGRQADRRPVRAWCGDFMEEAANSLEDLLFSEAWSQYKALRLENRFYRNFPGDLELVATVARAGEGAGLTLLPFSHRAHACLEDKRMKVQVNYSADERQVHLWVFGADSAACTRVGEAMFAARGAKAS